MSQCWWWCRWLDAHSRGSPCTAIAPQYARRYSSHLGVLKLLCESWRWYDSVMPRHPVMKYITRKQLNALQVKVKGASRQPRCIAPMNDA